MVARVDSLAVHSATVAAQQAHPTVYKVCQSIHLSSVAQTIGFVHSLHRNSFCLHGFQLCIHRRHCCCNCTCDELTRPDSLPCWTGMLHAPRRFSFGMWTAVFFAALARQPLLPRSKKLLLFLPSSARLLASIFVFPTLAVFFCMVARLIAARLKWCCSFVLTGYSAPLTTEVRL